MGRFMYALVYPFITFVLFLCALVTGGVGVTGHIVRLPEVSVSLGGIGLLVAGYCCVALGILPDWSIAIVLAAYCGCGMVATSYECRRRGGQYAA